MARNQYQKALIERFRNLPLLPPKEPWLPVATLAIGGFEALGFSEDSKYLLVLSSQGSSVIGSADGGMLARDSSPGMGDWLDFDNLRAEGNGPLKGQSVRLAGIFGGGLPTVSVDGWVLDKLAPDWPSSFVTLSSPGSSPWVEGQANEITRIAPTSGEDTVMAYGFSWDRSCFVVATSHGVDLFRR